MQIHNHWSCNDTLNPAIADADTVAPLPVNRRDVDGYHVTSSFWKPEPDELLWLQNGGVVMLSVLSSSHAPVRVDVVSDDRLLDNDIRLLQEARKNGMFDVVGLGLPKSVWESLDRVLATFKVQHD